jgi:hypothetical protein
VGGFFSPQNSLFGLIWWVKLMRKVLYVYFFGGKGVIVQAEFEFGIAVKFLNSRNNRETDCLNRINGFGSAIAILGKSRLILRSQ